MITCMGLVVGVVESAFKRDVLEQCAKFLKQYAYLQRLDVVPFEIDGQLYCTAIDTHTWEDGMFGVMFNTDTFTEVVAI